MLCNRWKRWNRMDAFARTMAGLAVEADTFKNDHDRRDLSENAPHGRKPAGQKRRRGRLSSRDKPVKHGKRRCKRRHRIESMFGRPED
jgi:hypothetical protein